MFIIQSIVIEATDTPLAWPSDVTAKSSVVMGNSIVQMDPTKTTVSN